MKYLGVGLSRTGTLSLSKAMKILGFSVLHWAPERLRDVILGRNQSPDFRRYDDVDVVTDIPAAYFYRELKLAYPECQLILTTRDVNTWYRSMIWHYNISVPKNIGDNKKMLEEIQATQKYIYGSEKLSEFLYKKKFTEFNCHVKTQFPNILEMNIAQGDGWGKLCPYVNKPIPRRPFPKENKRPIKQLI